MWLRHEPSARVHFRVRKKNRACLRLMIGSSFAPEMAGWRTVCQTMHQAATLQQARVAQHTATAAAAAAATTAATASATAQQRHSAAAPKRGSAGHMCTPHQWLRPRPPVRVDALRDLAVQRALLGRAPRSAHACRPGLKWNQY